MNWNSVFPFCILLSTILLTSCLGASYLLPSGGNRGAGIVEMSLEYIDETDVRIDWEHAYAQAYLKCKDWGYCDAAWSDLSVRECVILNERGCAMYQVTYTANCVECYTKPAEWHRRD